MCLVIAKPKGYGLPSRSKMKRWFWQFPDGFGIAFQYKGQVRILKGAMVKKDMFVLIHQMKALLEQEGQTIKSVDAVIQFRAAVTGTVNPRYCHPFPISDSQDELDAVDVMSHYALAHNGVIWEYNDIAWKNKVDINDAQEFIKDYLVDMGEDIENIGVHNLIVEHTSSKFAILTPSKLYLLGTYEKEDGLYYSNPVYKYSSYKQYNNYLDWQNWTPDQDSKSYYYKNGKKVPLLPSGKTTKNFTQESFEDTLSRQAYLHAKLDSCDHCGEEQNFLYEFHDSQLCYECYMWFSGHEPCEEDIVY